MTGLSNDSIAHDGRTCDGVTEAPAPWVYGVPQGMYRSFRATTQKQETNNEFTRPTPNPGVRRHRITVAPVAPVAPPGPSKRQGRPQTPGGMHPATYRRKWAVPDPAPHPHPASKFAKRGDPRPHFEAP